MSGQPKRSGRRTKKEEARAYLEELGVDPDTVLSGTDGDTPMPETFEGIRDEFLRILWRKRNDLSDTGFTQSLNALARLAEANKQADDAVKGEDPLVADVIGGLAPLPKGRRDEILKRELERLDMERGRILEVLNG